MGSRLDLQNELENLLESKNVYYQPPESIKMEYPAIKFKKTKIDKKSADNSAYKLTNCYELIVISKRPDHPVIEKILQLPMCSQSTHYVADNLNHDVFTLYY